MAAVIAAKLDQANKVAKQLSITASNARAVALRAGESAAGFKPLTNFIDELAQLTISSSKNINQIAANLSRVSADKIRVNSAEMHFNIVFNTLKDEPNVTSLNTAFSQVKSNRERLEKQYYLLISSLEEELSSLSLELRTAVILSTLSRVEAAQAKVDCQESLNNVAENVSSSAQLIKTYITDAQKLVDYLE